MEYLQTILYGFHCNQPGPGTVTVLSLALSGPISKSWLGPRKWPKTHVALKILSIFKGTENYRESDSNGCEWIQ